jgi:hypothetical protein
MLLLTAVDAVAGDVVIFVAVDNAAPGGESQIDILQSGFKVLIT